MQRAKALDELTPADLWREVPHDDESDEFWADTREKQLKLVKTMVEGALEEEMRQLLGAARFRRTEFRHGYRNGFYQRDLATQLGIVTAIRVPRARGEPLKHSVFSRYQRRQRQVNEVIREVFLAGVSTRRVGEALQAILGEPVSAQTVSRVTESLDREVARFHKSPISDDVRYLLLDGVYLRVKSPTVQRKLVLVAYGISVLGERRLLDFQLATAESQAQWERFLSDLCRRGLKGSNLKLIVTDGCIGLHNALDAVFPDVSRQLCWVHKLRNVSTYLKRAQEKECLSGARKVYQAENRRAAIQAYWAWAKRWRLEAPKAVTCLERDLEPLLNFFDCPQAHRRMVRTTNAIERCFREVRRRTRPMTCFNNNASCERIIYAVFSHLNPKNGGNPYRNLHTTRDPTRRYPVDRRCSLKAAGGV
jgi:transposase-like protein